MRLAKSLQDALLFAFQFFGLAVLCANFDDFLLNDGISFHVCFGPFLCGNQLSLLFYLLVSRLNLNSALLQLLQFLGLLLLLGLFKLDTLLLNGCCTVFSQMTQLLSAPKAKARCPARFY